MAEPARIVVIGSGNTDLVIRVDALPRPGETVLGGSFSQVGGGKGANQAVAAARAGGQVSFVAMLGDDDLGEAALAAYRSEGIDTGHVGRAPGTPSGVALIMVDAAGENAIAVASGANERLAAVDIDRAADVIATADVVLVQLEIPLETVRHAVGIAATGRGRVILNPAPARPLDPDLLAMVDLITPNETECQQLTGIAVHDVSSAERAAARLLDLGPRSAVITLGGQGCLVADATILCHLAAHPVTPLDTVAAGDVFNGALAVGLAEGRDLTAAAAFATAAAAIAVTRPGAQGSAPVRAEIDRLLAGPG